MSNQCVTSIDVGIKNISYCTLSYNPYSPSGNQYPILQWNVIDLIGAKQLKVKNPICNSVMGNGAQCKHFAHWTRKNNPENLSKMPTDVNICKMHGGHLLKSDPNIILERLFTPSNIELSELTYCMVKKFDQYDFSQSTQIVIELQPKIATQKMKDFSKFIMAYFIIRYMVEKRNNSQVQNVQFISASNKLTVYDGPYVECHLKNQYDRNKFYGKVYCRYLIRNDIKWSSFLQSFAKQDDLCDCFLQGVWYILSNDIKPSQSLNQPKKFKLKLKNENEINSQQPEDNNPDTKFKIKLKHVISGQEKLIQIKNNKTTRSVVIDSNFGKYKKLRKGYKPKPSVQNLTLSNIKYIFEKDKVNINTQRFINSVNFYFDSVENFISLAS